MRSAAEIGAALDVRRVLAEGGRLEIPAEVRRALISLALALNHGLGEEQLTVYAYTLRGCEIRWLKLACAEFAGTSKFFPKPVEILECAERLQRTAAAPPVRYLPPDRDEPTYRCMQCHDAPDGWRLLSCPGGLSGECGRHRTHPAHGFSVRCACWLRRHGEALNLATQKALQNNKPLAPDCEALAALEAGTYRWR